MANETETNKIIECPKCKNNVNSANNRCPKCGTSLKEAKIVAEQPTKPKVHPTVCPACNSPVKKTDKFCGNCGTPVEEEVDIINAKAGIGINKNEYNQALFSSNENTMLNGIVDAELKKHPDYRNKTVQSIETRKTVLTIILSIIILVFNTIYVSFHTNMVAMLFILTIIFILFFKAITKKNIKMYIWEQIKLRPDEKVSYVTASIMSAAKPKSIYVICRILILAISLLLSLGLFATPHFIYEKVEGGYNLRYYTYGILKNDRTIIVPKKYKNEPVIGIRGDVFKNVTVMEEIQLPDTIKEIRGGAFEGCKNLRKIILPSSLTKISGSTFKNCTSLHEVQIPSSVTEIGGNAFYNCINLSNINIPEGVTRIGGGAFYNCTSLYIIKIPDTTKEIGGEAFYNCNSLQSVKLPSTITEVRGSTFENCSSLEEITIPEGVTRIGGSAFRQCYNLKTVTIPKSVVEIGSSAFRGTSIENICVPENAYINERAFKDTYAKVAYYENDCIYSGGYGYEENDVFNNFNYDYNIDLSDGIISVFYKMIRGKINDESE